MTYLTMQMSDGQNVDAVVLRVSRERLRLAVPDRADTVELKLVEGQWVDENGARVSLESMWTDDPSSAAGFPEEPLPMASAARH